MLSGRVRNCCGSKTRAGVFGNIAHILQLNGYFAYLLTGKMAEDDSILGSSIYWNINTRQYWEEMLEYIGITRHSCRRS